MQEFKAQGSGRRCKTLKTDRILKPAIWIPRRKGDRQGTDRGQTGDRQGTDRGQTGKEEGTRKVLTGVGDKEGTESGQGEDAHIYMSICLYMSL